jgi:hypothetical protein
MTESDRHDREKKRIAYIANMFNLPSANEVSFPSWSEYHNHTIPYKVDVYIFEPTKKRFIIVEVDGFKGHDSRSAYLKDTVRREEDIKNMYGDNIEFYRFTLSELKIATPAEIMEHLEID